MFCFAFAYAFAFCRLRVARAQTEAGIEPVHVAYSAPAECPEEPEFFESVRARTARVRRARDDEVARTFSVAVQRTDSGYRATLEIVDGAGAVNRREVDGASCPEVISAVALVATLSVDPAAASNATTAAPVAATPPPVAATPPPKIAEAPRLPPTAAVIREPEPAARPTTPVRYRWSAGVAAEMRAVVVPNIAWGGGVHVDLAPTDGTFVPSFRLTAHVLTTHVDNTGITADLTWWLARAEVCSLRAGVATLLFEACAALDAGGLTTSGESGVDHPGHGTRAWGAAGIAPRLRWFAAPEVEVFLESILEFPFRNYELTYVSRSGQPVELIQMLPLSVDLALGAAYRFP